jgi:hypothetical protein
MPAPMQRPRFTKPDECAAGSHRPADNDEAVLTATGSILCAAHAWVVVPEAITARGPYRELRIKRNQIIKENDRG